METHEIRQATDGLSGSQLRGALRKAVRSTGEAGKWISYARNDELIAFLHTKEVPPDVLCRVKEDEEAKVRALEEQERDKARLEAERKAGRIEEAVDAVNRIAKEDGVTLSFSVPEKDPLYYRTGVGKLIEWHLWADMPLILGGPSGSGKTHPVRQECARLGRPLIMVAFNGGVLPSTFLGRWTAKNGATAFAEGLLPLAMRHGIVVCGDEFDFAPADISATLHSAMDVAQGRRPELYIPDTHANIRARDGFVIFLTCNSMGDETGVYSGTAPINGALTTRASKVRVDYPTLAEEGAMLRKAGATKEVAQALAKAMKDLRKAHFDDSSISLPPSLRQSIRIAQMTSTGWGRAAAMPLWMAARCTLIDGMTREESAVAEEILQRHGILSDGGPKFDPDAEGPVPEATTPSN